MTRKRTPTRVHRLCERNNGETELAEEMNDERGRQGEGIENIAAGKEKNKKEPRARETKPAYPRGEYSVRMMTHAYVCVRPEG